MERGFQPLRKQSLLRWHRIKVWGEGCREWNGGGGIEKTVVPEGTYCSYRNDLKTRCAEKVCCRYTSTAAVTCKPSYVTVLPHMVQIFAN